VTTRDGARRRALAAATVLIAFNVWHLTNRGSWNGSLGDALTLGPAIRAFAARVDPALRVFKPYDGQYYYAIAFDPWLRTREVVPLLDGPAYRYRRILLPALASTLALGRPGLFPWTLMLVNLTSWVLCGVAAWHLGRRAGLPAPWLALGVVATTGLVYSTFRTLPEPLALALVLWGILAFRSDRRLLAGALLGAAALAREDALLVPLIVGLHALLRERAPSRDLLRFGAVALLPAALWWSYLAVQLPGTAAAFGGRISWPFLGLLRETADAFELNRTRTNLLRSLTVNLVTAWLCLEAFFGLRRAPTLWGALAFGQALLCSTLRGDVWSYYAGSARVIVPLSVFSLFWFLERARGITGGEPARAVAEPGEEERSPPRAPAASGRGRRPTSGRAGGARARAAGGGGPTRARRRAAAAPRGPARAGAARSRKRRRPARRARGRARRRSARGPRSWRAIGRRSRTADRRRPDGPRGRPGECRCAG
jgi:hypothetical protein